MSCSSNAPIKRPSISCTAANEKRACARRVGICSGNRPPVLRIGWLERLLSHAQATGSLALTGAAGRNRASRQRDVGGGGAGFRCYCEFDRRRGAGAVIMANAMSGQRPWEDIMAAAGRHWHESCGRGGSQVCDQPIRGAEAERSQGTGSQGRRARRRSRKGIRSAARASCPGARSKFRALENARWGRPKSGPHFILAKMSGVARESGSTR